MKMSEPMQWALLFGVVAVGVVYLSRRAGEAAGAVGAAVDPTSRDNIFYSGVNAIYDVMGDGINNDSFSLGGWFYDATHPWDNGYGWAAGWFK